MRPTQNTPWWAREDLGYDGKTLCLSRATLQEIAEAAGRPVFVYSRARIRDNLRRLVGALDDTGLDYRLFYAMKANRFIPLLRWLRELCLCGVDVCSPGEIVLAEEMGFSSREMSYTGTSLSNRDIGAAVIRPSMCFNCDALSTIRRIGVRAPGRAVGIRVNPGIGLQYRQNPLLRYAGETTTKFGIYRDRFDEALALAQALDLRVEGIHFHCGCGYLTPELSAFERVLDAASWFIDRAPGLRYVNIGGGLGIPLTAEDSPLDLGAWSEILRRRFAGRDLIVMVEPGDYIVKDAGVLILQVNTVERKNGTLFVGVNGGFNLHPEPTFYKLPLHPAPCILREGTAQRVTIAGNINEAHDLLGEEVPLPIVEEGDFIGFLNAGGYGSAMSSDHCLRRDFEERLI